jgi:hypothetical protein
MLSVMWVMMKALSVLVLCYKRPEGRNESAAELQIGNTPRSLDWD